MKKTILLLSIIALIYSCEKQEPLAPNTYEITVTAKGVHNGMRAYIKLFNDNRKEVIIDTAIVMNEAFSFKGKVNNASMRVLTINSINGNVPFILEPGKINIEIYKDSIYNSKVKGSKNNDVFNLYKKEQRKQAISLNEIRQQINAARTSGDNDLYSELMAKNVEMNKESGFFVHQFIEEHPNSDFSLILLEKMINGRNQDIEKFTNSMVALANVINRNEANKTIGKKVEAFIYKLESQKNLEIGKIAPNFTSTTPNGEALSLNDIKGKVTIVEFWAAWCGPCRRENPNIVKVYNKYHEKGLEIIGVSLDGTGRQKDPKAIWLKAIEDDKLTWHQVSSLKYFNDPVAKLYNINSIPASFILDEDGKIVAKRLRGQALEDQIASMLD
ncbi:MAG: AhpC/TSA family protein [Flavobacteriaceae bacterium]|nr:AhpC/TSA family protein [Flavobacteriaceae bacterium]